MSAVLLYRNIGSNKKDAVSFSVQKTNAKNVCSKKADGKREGGLKLECFTQENAEGFYTDIGK